MHSVSCTNTHHDVTDLVLGFSQSVNNFLLDNIDKDIHIANNASTPVTNHQNVKLG